MTYSAVQSRYGYIYLTNGEPYQQSIEVRLNGVVIPQSSTNGWDYMGLQFTSALDMTNYKVVNYPYASAPTSGYFLRLNGTAQFSNSSNNTIDVYYTSKTN